MEVMDINMHKHIAHKLEQERDDYKTQRDTLIDDLSWYKAKVSRLEQRHSKLVGENTRLQNGLYTMGLNQDEADDKIKELERELKKKNMDADRLGYRWRNSHDEAKTYKTILSEISQHIGNKPSSSKYKYFRGKLNALEIREGE